MARIPNVPEVEANRPAVDSLTEPVVQTMKRWIGVLFVLGIFFAALLLLHRELEDHHWSDFAAALGQIRRGSLVAAIGFTMLNYVILIGYDWVGLRHVGHAMSMKKIAAASFLGAAVGNNFGSLLGGPGSVIDSTPVGGYPRRRS